MGKKLAIKGHPTRGKEVIELLEMIGGINDDRYIGTNSWKDEYYFLDNGYIRQYDWCDGIKFTLEGFLEKYPFKVGDKVFLYDNITEGCVTGMEWDEDKGTVKYCVYTSSEYWCDVEELLKWNNADLNERDYEEQLDNLGKTSVKNHKMGPKSKLPSKYYEDRPGMVPDKVDDKLEYDIIDGYEFDRVENGKIILKPIKSKYPKTYDKCCNILNVDEFVGYELMTNFPKLINARNAYWKIAGEEMGLGKPWEPNWTTFEGMPAIFRFRYNIVCDSVKNQHCLLVFPTEEMRDAFYENFKDLIEQCKELL